MDRKKKLPLPLPQSSDAATTRHLMQGCKMTKSKNKQTNEISPT